LPAIDYLFLKILIMRKRKKLIAGLIATTVFTSFISVYSQQESGSKFTAGADFYSSYIWRGTQLGDGPAIQPSAKYTGDIVTVGAWGSFDFSGFQETDLYLSFAVTSWLSLGLTDYYLPELQYNDFSQSSGSHAYEINAGFSKWNFSFQANYIINEAGGIGSHGGDKYFQAGYNINPVSLFIGAGDGWHTANPETGEDSFAVCNLGLGITKSIKITDSFSIPVNGQLIYNPDKEQMFLVAGFSLFP